MSVVPLMNCGATSRVNLSKVSSSGSSVPTLWGNQPCSASQEKTIQGLKTQGPSKKREKKFELPMPFEGGNLSVQEFVLVFSLVKEHSFRNGKSSSQECVGELYQAISRNHPLGIGLNKTNFENARVRMRTHQANNNNNTSLLSVYLTSMTKRVKIPKRVH